MATLQLVTVHDSGSGQSTLSDKYVVIYFFLYSAMGLWALLTTPLQDDEEGTGAPHHGCLSIWYWLTPSWTFWAWLQRHRNLRMQAAERGEGRTHEQNVNWAGSVGL